MSRDVSELLDTATPRGLGGPDLAAIELRVTRRRRQRIAGSAVAAAAVLVALLVALPAPSPVEIATVPDGGRFPGCPSLREAGQLVTGVDLDGDGSQDRAALVDGGASDASLVTCTADGGVTTLEVGPTYDTLESVALGDVGGIGLSRVEYLEGGADPVRQTVMLRWEAGRMAVLRGSSSTGSVGSGAALFPVENGATFLAGVESVRYRYGFGCRPSADGTGVEIITLYLEDRDSATTVASGSVWAADAARLVSRGDVGPLLPSELTPAANARQLVERLGAQWRCGAEPALESPARTGARTAAEHCGSGLALPDAITLDLDGVPGEEQVAMTRTDADDALLVACSGDLYSADAIDLPDDTTIALEVVNLGGNSAGAPQGGVPAVAVILESEDPASPHRTVSLVTWLDDLIVLGDPPSDTIDGGLTLSDGGGVGDPVRAAYGCRSSSRIDRLGEVAQLTVEALGSDRPRMSIQLWSVVPRWYRVVPSEDGPDLRELDPGSDPGSILRELGFTPDCTSG